MNYVFPHTVGKMYIYSLRLIDETKQTRATYFYIMKNKKINVKVDMNVYLVILCADKEISFFLS